jgi:IS5 family transposase
MLRITFLQQWLSLSASQVEDSLYDKAAIRNVVGIDLANEAAPDETTISKFRHLIETKGLSKMMLTAFNDHLKSKGIKIGTGTIMDTTWISAPSSTKNEKGEPAAIRRKI